MIMFLPSPVVIVYWIVSMYLSPFSHIHIHFCSFIIFYQIQLLVILFYCSSRNYTVYTQFKFLLRWFSTEVLCDGQKVSKCSRTFPLQNGIVTFYETCTNNMLQPII